MATATISEKSNGVPRKKLDPEKALNESIMESLHFRSLRPILREDIPAPARRGHVSSLRQLQAVRELNTLLDHVVTLGIAPYEVLKEVDITTPDVQAEAKKRKSFTGTFRSLLRDCVKQHGLSDKIDILEREHGSKFFVVGREV